jgi:Fe-S cluster assembly scaffold protein SufB
MREEHQLHAAVVEIIAENNAEVKYSTVQNWYPGDKNGKGGVFNFVTNAEYEKITGDFDPGGNRFSNNRNTQLYSPGK